MKDNPGLICFGAAIGEAEAVRKYVTNSSSFCVGSLIKDQKTKIA